MEVGSVSSSISTLLAASEKARVRQPEQDQQAQQAQQSQPSRPTQASPAVDESEKASRARSEAERVQPAPTVNANGQTVGTQINTTA